MKTMTDAGNWHFYFTVSDFARFIGKSPVTIRGWERKGLIRIPRDKSNNRKLSIPDVRSLTQKVYVDKKIDRHRLKLVEASLTLLEIIEKENQK